MNWFEALVSFVIIWWLVLFCVLPLGIKPAEPGDLAEQVGAPANPRIGYRLLLTTGIAAVVFGLVFALIQSDLISFRRME